MSTYFCPAWHYFLVEYNICLPFYLHPIFMFFIALFLGSIFPIIYYKLKEKFNKEEVMNEA